MNDPLERLHQALTDLGPALAAVRTPLPLAGAAEGKESARQISEQLRDYLLPRLESVDAPLLVVVGGSTGAGKSTLVNSLIGRVVSQPGVIRPTTKAPVLVHHPDDGHWYEGDRVLPGLVRSRIAAHDTRSLQLVAEPTLPKGLAILDAPDIDSIDEQNRRLAAQLLQASDLWLFVTSAARYADAVPWDYLNAAAERSAAVAVVCDRVPPAAMDDVPQHLGQLMTERGLADSVLFAVPETQTDGDSLLPDAAVSPIRTWLATLAEQTDARRAVVLQTLSGAVGALEPRLRAIAAAQNDQIEALAQLRADAEASYQQAARTVALQSSDGTLLRGEVLTRWQDFVGTGEFMRAIEQKISWLRDRIVGIFRAAPPEAAEVQVAAGAGLEALVREQGEAAAERLGLAWRGSQAGRHVLGLAPWLDEPDERFPTNAARAIRDWQADVLELVSSEGAGRRTRARAWALGVNGAGAALIVFLFASTGGLTGAEIGVAGGTSVLAQRVLEAVFGDGAVRKMAERAKSDLDARINGLYASELSRALLFLDSLGVDPDGGRRLVGIADELAALSGAGGHGLPRPADGSALPKPDAAQPIESAGAAVIDVSDQASALPLHPERVFPEQAPRLPGPTPRSEQQRPEWPHG